MSSQVQLVEPSFTPLRCWQFRLKELRIRTPSPMLGQVMFICVPSALWQWN